MTEELEIIKLTDAIAKFENKFDVKAEPTGAEIHDERVEKEYRIEGLVSSQADGMDFSIGGWISMDPESMTAHAMFALQLNNELLEEEKALMCDFDGEEWGDLRWEMM
jgi:hypothetical protein